MVIGCVRLGSPCPDFNNTAHVRSWCFSAFVYSIMCFFRVAFFVGAILKEFEFMMFSIPIQPLCFKPQVRAKMFPGIPQRSSGPRLQTQTPRHANMKALFPHLPYDGTKDISSAASSARDMNHTPTYLSPTHEIL